jgi:hypothetical protein
VARISAPGVPTGGHAPTGSGSAAAQRSAEQRSQEGTAKLPLSSAGFGQVSQHAHVQTNPSAEEGEESAAAGVKARHASKSCCSGAIIARFSRKVDARPSEKIAPPVIA